MCGRERSYETWMPCRGKILVGWETIMSYFGKGCLHNLFFRRKETKESHSNLFAKIKQHFCNAALGPP